MIYKLELRSTLPVLHFHKSYKKNWHSVFINNNIYKNINLHIPYK